MKRYSGRTKPVPRKRSAPEHRPVSRGTGTDDAAAASENKCLIRATLGSQKISTVVASKDMNRFQLVSEHVSHASRVWTASDVSLTRRRRPTPIC